MFDWKLGLFILQGITLIISTAGFILVKFNDLRHLSIDLNEIKEKLNDVGKEVNKIKEKQSAQIAICDERHGIKR